MSFSLFSVAIILLFFVILAIEVYRGVRKGVRQSLILLGSNLASVVLSVMLTPLLSMLITKLVFRLGVRRIAAYQRLLDMFASLDALIQALVSILLSVIMFVGMFFLIRAIFALIVKIICRASQKEKAENPEYRVEKNSYFDRNSKVLGGVAGAISAIVITMVITAPIMGGFDVAYKVVGTVERVNTKIVNRIGEKNVQAIKTYAMDIPGNVFYQFGGKYIFQGAASTYLCGERADLMTELDVVDQTVEDGLALYRALMSSKIGTTKRVEYVHQLCEDMDDFRICQVPAAEVISKAATAWGNGEKFYGISMPKFNPLYDPVVDELLDVYARTDVDSVEANAVTALKIFAVMIESKVLYLSEDDYDEFLEIMQDGNFVNKMNAILNENPNMRGINLSALALSAVSTHLKDNDIEAEKLHVFAGDMAQAVNSVNKKGYGSDEERATALATYAVEYIEDYGLTVSPEIAQLVAGELLKKLPASKGEVTADQICEIIDEYAK